MGRKFDDPVVQEAIKRVPYKVTRAKNGDVRVAMGGKEYSPPEISAMILQKLRADAEAKLGDKVTQAVITVPAYFDDAQRQATKDAGQIAGLEVLRIVNEPTAAALAYGLDRAGKEEVIAVYDLGGGTFDISILRVGEGVFEVLATNGDTFLGGDDFDRAVMDWIIAEFKKEQGIDLAADRMALQRVREAAEKAKIELSSGADDRDQPAVHHGRRRPGPTHLPDDADPLQAGAAHRGPPRRGRASPVAKALADAKVKPADVDEVVLVGGQTRMPARPGPGQGAVRRQGAAQGRQPRRGRGGRRGDPGRRARAATSRTCCCWTSRRCRSASRPRAA